ncbi:MAG: DNA mismatch repair endonuclease MutL [Clostridia bacterium]|nr:DNA mismatch repair endonuclease MutL [Clostridia bacterium]
MPKIYVLDKYVAELIAAGEVVERPASVIKELVENSIDAGASVITIEICRGGTTFMRVTDNGCGIDREDVTVAFLRHATSKVHNQYDLDCIGTLGFRGEALASISAVSHVELITKTHESQVGTRVVCNAGEIDSVADAGCPNGTTIIVRDLFYNVPARMKFLKKDVAEGNSVAKLIDKIGLSHPEISFRFIRDGKEVLHTPGDNKLRSAIYAVYGKDFTKGLIPVDYSLNNIRIYGFISSPHFAKPTRNMQNFFINGRCVRSKTAMAALEEAYKNSILVGKFPACVLHIQMDFSNVDVNVHPAKLEIRFTNERPVFDAVYHGVKSALTAGDTPKVMGIKPNPINPYVSNEKVEQTYFPEQVAPIEKLAAKQTKVNPQPPVRPSMSFTHEITSHKEDSKPYTERNTTPVIPPAKIENNSRVSLIEKIKAESFSSLNQDELGDELGTEDLFMEVPPQKAEQAESQISPAIISEETHNTTAEHKSEQISIAPVQEKTSEELPAEIPGQKKIKAKYIGEAFNTYIILEYSDDKLMLIDKHAAHERILYERLKKSEEGKNAQQFLAPIPVLLEKDDYTSVLMNLDRFAEVGFEIDDFGDGTVLVRTAPMLLDGQDAAEAVTEIASYLTQNKTAMTTEYMDWLYHNIACRAAVKAGNKNSTEELIEIARLLEENPEIRYCPHGRPVSIIIRKRDIEKEFGRIV